MTPSPWFWPAVFHSIKRCLGASFINMIHEMDDGGGRRGRKGEEGEREAGRGEGGGGEGRERRREGGGLKVLRAACHHTVRGFSYSTVIAAKRLKQTECNFL